MRYPNKLIILAGYELLNHITRENPSKDPRLDHYDYSNIIAVPKKYGNFRTDTPARFIGYSLLPSSLTKSEAYQETSYQLGIRIVLSNVEERDSKVKKYTPPIQLIKAAQHRRFHKFPMFTKER